MSKRNPYIEAYRFIFALTVIFVHLPMFFTIENGLFRAAFFSMEFFFYVSGVFLGRGLYKKMDDKPFIDRQKLVIEHIKARIRRLFPLYITALFLELFVKTIEEGLGLSGAFGLFKECLAEFFMLQWTPLGNGILISAMWFMPAVFFGDMVMTVLISFAGKKIRQFYLFACPVITAIVYVYICVGVGKTDVIVSYYGVIRGIAGIAFGCFLHGIYLTFCEGRKDNKTKEEEVGDKEGTSDTRTVSDRILFIIGNVILIAVLILENFAHRGRWNFIILLFIAAAVYMIVYKAGKMKNEKLAKTCLFLGSLSFPIYMFHVPVMHIIKLVLF